MKLELHRVHVPTQHLGDPGVAEEVGVDPLSNPGLGDRVFDHLVDAALGERLIVAERPASEREEDGVRTAFLGSGGDEAVKTPHHGWGDRHIADAIALAMDAEVDLTSTADQVAGVELGELLEAEAAVGKDPDDDLVALLRHCLLELVDLRAAQYVPDGFASARQLGHGPHGLAFVPCPVEEQANRPDVGGDGVPGERRARLCGASQQLRGEAVHRTPIELAELGDALPLAKGKQLRADRVGVLVLAPGREPPGAAVAEVVVSQAGKGGGGARREHADGHGGRLLG